jgi:hypothetical protein
LLFFGVDGADIVAIPCRLRGPKSKTGKNNMKQFIKLAAAPATVLFAMAFVAMATPASAGEFCRQDTSGMLACGFSSMEQCQASSSGRGGSCSRDPFLPNPSNALAYQPKQSGKAARKPFNNQ